MEWDSMLSLLFNSFLLHLNTKYKKILKNCKRKSQPPLSPKSTKIIIKNLPTMHSSPQSSLPPKRNPTHRNAQDCNHQSKPKKRQKTQNPFDSLLMIHEQEQNGDKKQWIKSNSKPVLAPLSISVVDHSRVNKYYSHKSLQKYIRYLIVNEGANPMWMSIKRKSQVSHITFLDIQIQNNLFHYYISQKYQSTSTSNTTSNIHTNQTQTQKQKQQQQQQHLLPFLSQYNQAEIKAVFKQSKFLKDSYDVLDALLVDDGEAVKEENAGCGGNQELAEELTEDLFKLYQTYMLTQQQLRNNLYPTPALPIYSTYYKLANPQQSPQTPSSPSTPLSPNKILIIDCQMVMSGTVFQLARTSIMNFKGQLIYDELFKPDSQITNYNTQYSGITEEMLKGVKKNIGDLHLDLKGLVGEDAILVGHSLENDLHAMKFMHHRVIDTSILFSRKNGSKMKLKTLAYTILNRQIQIGSHCSSQDCKATLDLLRRKIQQSQITPQTQTYHLLNELIKNQKKVVIIDTNLQFIKHRKEYLGVHFQNGDFCQQNRESFGKILGKYFQRSSRNPELVIARIRKSEIEEWQSYYKNLDSTIQKLYKTSPKNNVFFLNFQVNNRYEIYPKKIESTPESRRPFCIFLVKNQ